MKRKLLSILLCLVMALSLLPTAALAEGEKVARVGDTAEYTTLADAIEAAQGGETVTLLADITGQTEIPAGKNIVLDLNGKTMTHTGTTLYNSGTLTVRDSSAEKSGKIVSTGNVGIGVNHNSITTIEYANIEAVEGAVITGYATGAEITIQDGIFAASDNAVIAGNGNSTDHSGTERKNANTITINGGKFTGNIKTPGYIACGIYAPWKDIVTVNGGEFTVNNGIGIVARAGQVKVNGGTFTCSGSAAGKVGDKNFNMTAAQCLYFDATDPAYPAYNSTTDYIKVTGGTFSSDVSAYVADGYILNNGTVEKLGETNAVAKVGDTYYKTLAAAIAAAQDSETIKLLKDCSSERVNLEDKCITIDLNGNTLTSTSAYGVMFCAKNGHKITVNGTKEGSKLVGTLMVTAGTDGHIEINGGTYESSLYCPIYINGAVSSENSTLTVKNAIITASNSESSQDNGVGVYLAGYSTSAFENTTVTAPSTGIEIRAGRLTLTNCNVTGGNGNVAATANGNGNTVQNAALAISQHTTNKPIDVTINGGTFTGTAPIYQTDVQGTGSSNVKAEVKNGQFNGTVSAATNGTIAVSGGTFSSAVPVNCCAPGFEPTKNDDGTYGVKIKANLAAEVLDAQGNTVGAYDTLTAAITAAQNGDTVVLLKNVTENVTISADKTITLDLNGKKLTNADEQDTITVALGASLTVTGTGTVDNVTHGKAAVYNKGTVTLADGTYERSAEAGKDANDAGGNSFYTVLNHGNMTVEADVVVNNKGKYSSLFENGYYNYSNRDGVVNPTLTIKGGTFDGGLNTIKNDDNATLTIKDGTFQNYTQAAFQNHNIATVEGGTFIGGGSAKAVLQCGVCSTADEEHDKHQLTISSGYFFGEITKTVGTISITGGTFSSDPSVYVVGNGSANIVKRDGSEGAYTYTVLAKSGLTSGVYLTNPSGALASNYYVSSTANGVWTVSYSAPYSGGSSSYVPTYSVSTPSKTENGSVTVSPKNASKGDTVTVTVKPDSGYVLETLTVTDKNGNELTLKDKGNGKYTFTMPAGKVEVKATFMEDNSMLNFFYDVPNNAYFYEAVKWAVKNGITTGVGDNLFAPEQPCTRAQIVTFLWRAAGSPEPKGAASGMTDVVSGSYYEKAVAWAIENGITTGTTTSTFSPDATCTRAQAVTFLARALNAKATSVAEFSDVPTNSYFADAVAWAAANGVTEGIGGGLFGSDNDCTRGQIVTFLYRAYNK